MGTKLIDKEPEEVFDELNFLRREFPELSEAAIVQMFIMLNTEEEEEEDE